MDDYGYLAHYGVKGQKWGVRRYQNKDGTRIKTGRGAKAKDIAKKVGKSVAIGAVGGIASGAVTLAFAAAAPGSLPTSAVFAVGKSICTRAATSAGMTLASEVMNSSTVSSGKKKVTSMLKGR